MFRVAVAQAILISSFCISFECFAVDEERSLRLLNVHTGERAEITFKRRGKYSKEGLDHLNRFLRDWRRNEHIEMDPKLFDLLWEVYKESDSRKHIHVFSAYRTNSTNEILRVSTKGVAKNSQHTRGKAIDFSLPDVKLSKLQAIAMRKQAGGVGIYPSSNSPFAHLDTGNVRHWPRLTRKQLVGLFPDERTVHIPIDGIPLSGFKQAKLDVQESSRINSNALQAANRQSQVSFAGDLVNHFNDIPVPRAKPSSFVVSNLHLTGAQHIPRSKPASELSSIEIQLAILPTNKPKSANQPEIGRQTANSLSGQKSDQSKMLLSYFPNEEQDAAIQDLDLIFASPNQKPEQTRSSIEVQSKETGLSGLIRKSMSRETEIVNSVEQPDAEFLPTDFRIAKGHSYGKIRKAESRISQTVKTVEKPDVEILPTIFRILTGFSFGNGKEAESGNSQSFGIESQNPYENTVYERNFWISAVFKYFGIDSLPAVNPEGGSFGDESTIKKS